MNALISFLLVVPEEVRVHMVEAAVEVLLDEGLADSASCLLGNVASTSPANSQAAEVFYRRSLEIVPQNPNTGDLYACKGLYSATMEPFSCLRPHSRACRTMRSGRSRAAMCAFLQHDRQDTVVLMSCYISIVA